MIDQFLKRLATTIASLLAATILVLAALGFLGYAAYLALLGAVSPPLAALIIGIGAVVLAALVVVVGSSLFRGSRAKPRTRDSGGPGAAGRMAGELGGVLAVQLGTLTRSHSGPVLAASLAAGFAVGASPGLRKVLLDLMLPR